MFRRLADSKQDHVEIFIDGEMQSVPADISVAAALTMFINTFRFTPIGGQPRGPFCMMGVCFDCLVSIDGVSNQRSCMVTVENGMRVETQRGIRSFNSLQ